MNVMPALSNWQWALLAAVPIGIILLYFLKLRRQPVQVPSTFLWARTIEDLHVNSLLQRLRRSLLLLLQLLVVALAALALLRPGWQADQTLGKRQIFLLDQSASMNARDGEAEATRFEQARRQIRERIEAMDDSEVAMLIGFSDRANVLQAFTADRRRLREALQRAQPTSRPTDVLEALRAADGLANPNRTSQAGDVNDFQVADAKPADLLLFSDGGFQAATEFDLGNLRLRYFAVGTDRAENLGIVAFSAERNLEQPAQVQAFARVANLGASPQRCTATLFLDGEFLDATQVELPPEEEQGLSFELTSAEPASLRLELDIEDDLAVDNVAYAGISPMRTVSVLLVTPGNQPLELALQTTQAAKVCQLETVPPGFLQSDAYRTRAEEGIDDLILYDRCAPATMPRTSTVFLGALPPAGWSAGEPTSPVLLIDIDRTHPIMRFLELFSLQIVEGRPLEGPAGTSDLLTADAGPVMSIAPREGYQDLIVGFEILSATEDGGSAFNTDWPVQRSWPVFWLNVLRHVGGAVELGAAASHRPGETVTLRVDNRLREVAVTRPDGSQDRLQVGPGGVTPIAATEQTGLYRVAAEETPLALFAVNLLDVQEGRLTVAPDVQVGYEPPVSAEGVEVAGRSELWRWLLLAAVGLLAAEWFVYSRRLG